MDWLSVALIPLVHEAGHYVAARLFGSRLVFRFSWGRFKGIPIPRWVWYWPQGLSEVRFMVVCHAGFALELAMIPLLPWPYGAAAIAHYWAYPFYAGEMSDFEGLRG